MEESGEEGLMGVGDVVGYQGRVEGVSNEWRPRSRIMVRSRPGLVLAVVVMLVEAVVAGAGENVVWLEAEVHCSQSLLGLSAPSA